MKTNIYLFISTLVIIIFLSACEKFSEREFPRVRTLPATKINSEGVTLNAEILNPGSFSISECGFLIYEGQPSGSNYIGMLNAEYDQKKGIFNKIITTGLQADSVYFYQAYTISDTLTTYGDYESFINKCDEKPEVSEYSPKTGHVLDTVYFKFKGFTGKYSDYEVSFSDFSAKKLISLNDSLPVIVPEELTDKENTIRIKVSDDIIFEGIFTLQTPEILSFSPHEAEAGDIITISGNNFHRYPEYNIIKFNNTISSLINSSENELQVIAPGFQNENETCSISVAVSGQETIADGTILIHTYLPIISSFSPHEVYSGDIVTINGANFSSSINENTIRFNDTEAQIISCTNTEIRVIAPNLEGQECTISVSVLGETYTTINKISILEIPVLWKKIADFPGGEVYNTASFVIGNYGYSGTGTKIYQNYLTNLWRYDPNSDTWSVISDYPGDTRVGAFGFALNSKGYIGCGYDLDTPSRSLLNDFFSYNPSTDSWSGQILYNGEMPTIYYNPISAVVENKAYIAFSPEDFYSYSEDGTWENINTGSAIIYCGSATFSLGPYIYFVCGNDNRYTGNISFDNNVDDIWRYNTENNSWQQMDNFPGGSRYGGIAFVIDNTAYFGLGRDANNYFTDIWEYIPEGDTWVHTTDFPGSGRTQPIVMTIDNKTYIGTGKKGINDLLNDMYRFDPSVLK